LNILFLSELFYPHGGGAELATYLYAKLLAEAEMNVVVVTNRFGEEPEFSRSEGFVVYRLPLFKKGASVKYSALQRFDVLLSSFMRKWLKWADVIYVPRFWFSVVPVAKAMGKPVVVHLHDYIPICPLAVLYDFRGDKICDKDGLCSVSCIYAYERNRKRGLVGTAGSTFLNLTVYALLKRFVEYSDAIICVSKAQRNTIVKYSPSLTDKIRVIYNPMPSLLPIKMDGDDFGYFGGSNIMKGFRVLCNAMKMLNDSSIRVRGVNFSRMNVQLARFLRQLNIWPSAKLGYDEMGAFYTWIRCVVVPSVVAETFSYVVSEAILRGRIVIASNIGGIPEQVNGCKGVYLFDAGNAEQLAEKIRYVSSLCMEEAIRLGIHNHETFTAIFNNHKTLKKFLKMCEGLVKK